MTGSAAVQKSKREAILRAIPLAEGDLLRADKLTQAERALYVPDALRPVLSSQQPAGGPPGGARASGRPTTRREK